MMSGKGRFRWLSYPECQLSPWRWRERAVSIGVLVVAIIAVACLGRDAWWGTWGPWMLLLADYVLWSAVATRDWGRQTRPLAPWAIISLREWVERLKDRYALAVLGYLPLVAAMPVTGPSEEWRLLLLVPVPWVADYLWCCASRGAWLATLPPAPSVDGPMPRAIEG